MLANKEHLLHKKNLLAFSAGGDSTALFFLLLESNITFDIAIVDYGIRAQSKEEVAYAKELADKYNLQCYIHEAPQIQRNFEATARDIRYTFFEQIIKEHHYDNLLTAHHLGDRFEWMLMQFCKGSGCAELAGMQSISTRDGYTLIRPLLHLDKSDLLTYLARGKRKYFEDESNADERYTRNSFRKNHTQPLLIQYKDGIIKSFTYIDEDRESLVQNIEVATLNDFAYFTSHSSRADLHAIDRYFKSLGHLITAQEKALLKTAQCTIIGRKFVVAKHEQFIFIAPYITEITMTKEFKEKMRKLGIEPKLRGYFFQNNEAEKLVTSLLS